MAQTLGPQVHGHCDPKFEKIKTLFKTFLDESEENGASIVANIDGQIVLDVWGGYADEEKTKPWEKDTIVNVWSSTKTIASLAVLMCCDRGLMSVDDKVAKHWPEFAAKGKEHIEIRHLLSHTSGLSAWDPPFSYEDLYDLEKSTALLAAQAPWWEPGTASAYHAVTFGHLLGELVRRATGKSFTQFVAEEIAGPVGADFQIGAKEEDWPRIAALTPPPPPPPPEGEIDMQSIAMRTFTSPAPKAEVAMTEAWRKAEIGAANGHGNARSLNRIMCNIPLGGEVDGHRFLSQKTIDRIFDVQSTKELALPIPVTFGIGYGLAQPGNMLGIPDGRVCFWGGWGGSLVIMDLDHRSTFTFVMNKMGAGTTGNPRSIAYLNAFYEAMTGDEKNARI
jgi:CubicO group peptidase (beta-lactamase class C family)